MHRKKSIFLFIYLPKTALNWLSNFFFFKEIYNSDALLLKSLESNNIVLNPNHSNFIFYKTEKDDNIVGKNEVKKFRIGLEKSIKESNIEYIVILVIEGGFNTLEAIKNALDSNIPVLLIAVSLNLQIFFFLISN